MRSIERHEKLPVTVYLLTLTGLLFSIGAGRAVGSGSHASLPRLLQPVLEQPPLVELGVRVHTLRRERMYESNGEVTNTSEIMALEVQDVRPYSGPSQEGGAMLLDSRDDVRAFYSLTGYRAPSVLAHDLTIMLGPAEPLRQLAGSAETDSSPDKTLSTIKPLASRDLYLHILYWRCDENREVSVSYPIDAPEASGLFTWMLQRLDLGENWTPAHPEAPQFLHQLLVESNKRPVSLYCSRE